ncbi:mediator of RNA polymerase II transcription subunit 8-like [Oscarella lobularis]|uniref:mediator of RNA polymerase II transcription subunit 8-like n=1 Tax=Oscarella lobularis TaxID=121494 RepID=UPI0033136F68
MDATLSSLVGRIQDIKGSLSSLMMKLEKDQAQWPVLLDSFATLSGQVNMLLKQLKSDKAPALHSRVVWPCNLSNKGDEELEKVTEGRIPVFHHEVVPDYLRTKLDLDLERQQQEMEAEGDKLTPEAAKLQINQLNERAGQILATISQYRENWGAVQTW